MRGLCREDRLWGQAKRLAIRRPEKFDLVINLKTTEALGVTVRLVWLATADEVIE